MIHPLQIAGAGVSVIFAPSEDRFIQQIEVSGVTLQAVDEAAGFAESWPPSPPLQDVHLEQRPNGRQLALMIGRAGLSHWSISCELDSSSGEVLFDVACRIKEPIGWLGSTYQLAPGVSFHGDHREGELRLDKDTLCRLVTEDDCEMEWDPDWGQIIFSPQVQAVQSDDSSGTSFPRTIRWRYRLIPAEE